MATQDIKQVPRRRGVDTRGEVGEHLIDAPHNMIHSHRMIIAAAPGHGCDLLHRRRHKAGGCARFAQYVQPTRGGQGVARDTSSQAAPCALTNSLGVRPSVFGWCEVEVKAVAADAAVAVIGKQFNGRVVEDASFADMVVPAGLDTWAQTSSCGFDDVCGLGGVGDGCGGPVGLCLGRIEVEGAHSVTGRVVGGEYIDRAAVDVRVELVDVGHRG